MAVGALSTVYPTFLDFASREEADGKIASSIIEIASKTNDILQDMSVQEGNLPVGNRTTVRTGLPTATWRLLNYGVVPTKSITAQVDDTCGMLEIYNEVDVVEKREKIEQAKKELKGIDTQVQPH